MYQLQLSTAVIVLLVDTILYPWGKWFYGSVSGDFRGAIPMAILYASILVGVALLSEAITNSRREKKALKE